MGLAYKRRDSDSTDRFAVCAAQMFLASGEGVVFRGALGPWYRADTEQYHLDEPAARDLVAMVIAEYREQHGGRPPSELFLHAKSSFTDEEWNGFGAGVPPETNLVGVQIADAKDNLKLFRPGKYPIIRGSALMLSEDQAFLWNGRLHAAARYRVDFFGPVNGGSGWPDELRSRPCRNSPSSWPVHWSNPQGCEACRPSRRAVHQIRICHQPANGQRAWY